MEKLNVRILKSTVCMDEEYLAKQFGSWDEVAQAIINGDSELNLEIIGKKLSRTRRLWIDKEGRIAYHVNLFRTIFNPDGGERERQYINKLPGNVNKEVPLLWTGRMFFREEVVRKFVFTRSYQLKHLNGATFDFLYSMAELHEKGTSSDWRWRKGKRSYTAITRGQPYRAFLEGRIKEDRYILILHLTDIELNKPEDGDI